MRVNEELPGMQNYQCKSAEDGEIRTPKCDWEAPSSGQMIYRINDLIIQHMLQLFWLGTPKGLFNHLFSPWAGRSWEDESVCTGLSGWVCGCLSSGRGVMERHLSIYHAPSPPSEERILWTYMFHIMYGDVPPLLTDLQRATKAQQSVCCEMYVCFTWKSNHFCMRVDHHNSSTW